MQLSKNLSFMRADKLESADPASIRTVRIISVADGFQLRVTRPDSTDEWTLTSPGGLADTFPNLPGLHAFATTVFSGKPLSLTLV